ncbi:MAG: hypothetical protein JXR50_11225 [Prolixibacteraceae bacterium]|nr:hypothetical protein [Prolixibacteraceae bacterium]
MKKLLLISLVHLVLTSCNFWYTSTNGIQIITQLIGGVEYTLTSSIDIKNDDKPYSDDFKFEIMITFHGMDKVIEKVISESDFKKKIDFEKIKQFKIERIMFSVNPTKDKIDLNYRINFGDKTETVTFILQRDGGKWNLK